MEARLATRSDIVKRTKVLLPDLFVGYVVEQDGQFMGMGWVGWGKDDRPFVFFEITDEGRKYKYRIGRWSKRFIDVLSEQCEELYTIESDDEPGATKWIEWLGFRATDERINGLRVMKR